VRDLISPESLARAGYFDVERVRRDCELLARGEGAKLGTFASLGLGGVVATQLWHHLYLGGSLCELPHSGEHRLLVGQHAGQRALQVFHAHH
jgi:asparagine synthase (glutamine-hydrolysing)